MHRLRSITLVAGLCFLTLIMNGALSGCGSSLSGAPSPTGTAVATASATAPTDCEPPSGLNVCALQVGDILLEETTDTSNPVCRAEWLDLISEHIGPWMHAALYAGNGQVVEAIPTNPLTQAGVVLRSIQQSDFWNARYFEVLRLKAGVADTGKPAQAVKAAKAQVGRPYNYAFSKDAQLPFTSAPAAFYCSQLVWWAYTQTPDPVNLQVTLLQSLHLLKTQAIVYAVTPNDIARSEGVYTERVQGRVIEMPEHSNTPGATATDISASMPVTPSALFGTWRRADSGTRNSLYGITCSTSGTCLAVGENGTILASSVGRTTWHSQSSNTSQELRGVACPSTSACLAVGDMGTILASSDGGTTWRSVSNPLSDNPQLNVLGLRGITCPSSTACLAVGDADTILASSDGGTTWRNVGNPLSDSDHLAYNLEGVTFSSSSTCLAVEDGGTILATSDGGASWQIVSGSEGPLLGITCAPSGMCLAVGGMVGSWVSPTPGTILASRDGGVNWQIAYSGTGNALHSVTCPTSSTCLAVGWSGNIGSILASRDSGATWQSVSSGTGNALHSVTCNLATHKAAGHQRRHVVTDEAVAGHGQAMHAEWCPDAETETVVIRNVASWE